MPFILFLALKPGIDTLSSRPDTWQICCSIKCTSDNDRENSPVQNNTSGGKACNPFQVCGSCVFTFFNSPVDYLPEPSAGVKKHFNFPSGFTSLFATDFWQPPKIV
jgi:hypothetical protein